MKTEEFKFENGLSVRMPLMENETSWFIASDVCDILGLTDTSQSVEKLDDDEKRKEKITSNGQLRPMWLINEFGLYQLILTSDKPEAKLFKRWITHEILPTIRKESKYTKEEAKNRESLIQGKIVLIELTELKIRNARDIINEQNKNLSKYQLELKQILKADTSQLSMIFDTEQVEKPIENN